MKKFVFIFSLIAGLLIAPSTYAHKVGSGYNEGAFTAEDIEANTDNFDGIASILEDTVQKVLDVFDDIDTSAGDAPDSVDYLVGTASGDLSAEIVVGTTPGGELGGTWASPTIDDLFLKNNEDDTMIGTLTVDGLTLGDDENITLGSDTLDYNSFNDVFFMTVGLWVQDPVPALRFVDSTFGGDDYEFYADADQFYLKNADNSTDIFKVETDDSFTILEPTSFNDKNLTNIGDAAIDSLSDDAGVENTLTIANLNTAYDHSQDNTQGHTDYLLNNAADTGVALTLSGATSVPLTLNNSTGTQAIVKFQDNGDTIFQIDNGGLIKIADAVATPITATKMMILQNRTATSSNQLFACRLDQEGVISVSKRIVQSGNYKLKIDGASTNGYFYGMVAAVAPNHISADVQRAFGLKAYYQGVNGTIDDAGSMIAEMVIGPTALTRAMGIYVPAATISTGSATKLASFWADKQTVGDTDYGIVLNGDSAGANLVLGGGQDTSDYYDGTNRIIDPDIVGSGRVRIGASDDNDLSARHLFAAGDNAGLAGTIGLTGTSDVTANSTGVGTIKFKGATSRDSTGFIKIYVGTTAYYIPIWSAITG